MMMLEGYVESEYQIVKICPHAIDYSPWLDRCTHKGAEVRQAAQRVSSQSQRAILRTPNPDPRSWEWAGDTAVPSLSGPVWALLCRHLQR